MKSHSRTSIVHIYMDFHHNAYHFNGIVAVCVKSLERNSKGFLVIVQVKWKGYEKSTFLHQYAYLASVNNNS